MSSSGYEWLQRQVDPEFISAGFNSEVLQPEEQALAVRAIQVRRAQLVVDTIAEHLQDRKEQLAIQRGRLLASVAGIDEDVAQIDELLAPVGPAGPEAKDESVVPSFRSSSPLLDWLDEKGLDSFSLWFDEEPYRQGGAPRLSLRPWLEQNRRSLRDRFDAGKQPRTRYYGQAIGPLAESVLPGDARTPGGKLAAELRDKGAISEPQPEDDGTFRVDVKNPKKVLAILMKERRQRGLKYFGPAHARAALIIAEHQRTTRFPDATPLYEVESPGEDVSGGEAASQQVREMAVAGQGDALPVTIANYRPSADTAEREKRPSTKVSLRALQIQPDDSVVDDSDFFRALTVLFDPDERAELFSMYGSELTSAETIAEDLGLETRAQKYALSKVLAYMAGRKILGSKPNIDGSHDYRRNGALGRADERLEIQAQAEPESMEQERPAIVPETERWRTQEDIRERVHMRREALSMRRAAGRPYVPARGDQVSRKRASEPEPTPTANASRQDRDIRPAADEIPPEEQVSRILHAYDTRRGEVSHLEKQLLLAICSGRSRVVSASALARVVPVDKRDIQKGLDELERKGLVNVESQTTQGHKRYAIVA